MKRYSIAPSSSRRKSTANINAGGRLDDNIDGESATLELERLEQETTLVLQEIDKNLSKANAVINDKIYPILKKYATSSGNVWNNVNFWKYFLEQAANVELTSYEAPTSLNTELNTLANTKNNFLLQNEEDRGNVSQNDEVGAGHGSEMTHKRPPMLKGFNNVEELTPTWSAEEQRPASNVQYNMESSTPQFKQRLSYLSNRQQNRGANVSNWENISTANKQSDVLVPSAERSSTGKANNLQNNNSGPLATHTIRRSLGNYQKFAISPTKHNQPYSSAQRRGDDFSDEARGRSSVIQNLIDSSPTLPEPPVLLSEIGNSNSENNDNEQQAKNLERLSPIMLPQLSSTTPKSPSTQRRTLSKGGSIQRFPQTPNFLSKERNASVDINRTPQGVSQRFNNDSDILPLELNTEAKRGQDDRGQHEEADKGSTLLPDLETTSLHQNEKRGNARDDEEAISKKRPRKGTNEEENVFLETRRSHSVNSTLYHSLVVEKDGKDQQGASNANATPGQNDNNLVNSNSRSVSNLFEEVLSNTNVANKDGVADKDHYSKGDDLTGGSDGQKSSANNQSEHLSANNTNTENSTSELGSLLGERLKTFTSYSRKFSQ